MKIQKRRNKGGQNLLCMVWDVDVEGKMHAIAILESKSGCKGWGRMATEIRSMRIEEPKKQSNTWWPKETISINLQKNVEGAGKHTEVWIEEVALLETKRIFLEHTSLGKNQSKS